MSQLFNNENHAFSTLHLVYYHLYLLVNFFILFIWNFSGLSGRRIIDVSYFIKQIQIRHNRGICCSFIDIEFQSEIIYGFHSIFYFNCKVCGIKSKLFLEKNTKTTYYTINKAVINGCQAVGKYVKTILNK